MILLTITLPKKIPALRIWTQLAHFVWWLYHFERIYHFKTLLWLYIWTHGKRIHGVRFLWEKLKCVMEIQICGINVDCHFVRSWSNFEVYYVDVQGILSVMWMGFLRHVFFYSDVSLIVTDLSCVSSHPFFFIYCYSNGILLSTLLSSCLFGGFAAKW